MAAEYHETLDQTQMDTNDLYLASFKDTFIALSTFVYLRQKYKYLNAEKERSVYDLNTD